VVSNIILNQSAAQGEHHIKISQPIHHHMTQFSRKIQLIISASSMMQSSPLISHVQPVVKASYDNQPSML
jgi:hypothetical protein